MTGSGLDSNIHPAANNFFSWDPDWTIVPGAFDADNVTDFFLFQPSGKWAVKSGLHLPAPGGEAQGVWRAGWTPIVMDLNGDNVSDVFLFDQAIGQWFECLWDPGTKTFSYTSGWWTAGWELTPMNLNGDWAEDLFLFNPTTGQWFWAINDGAGGFTYPQTAFWSSGWILTAGDITGDGFSDMVLYRPSDGSACTATTSAGGFAYDCTSWGPGWTNVHVVDMNPDGRRDVLLHRATESVVDGGQWVEWISRGNGQFTEHRSGSWPAAWRLFVTDIDRDGCADLLFHDRTSGAWHMAINLLGSALVYFNDILTQRPLPGETFTVVAGQRVP